MSDSMVNGAVARSPWPAFVVAASVIALTILDLTKVTVGLPSIERSLHASSGDLQLIVSGYVLAFGLALVPAGRLGDIHSRKLMFIVGLVLFTAGSLACALSPNITVLIIARLVQGIAAGIQMPQALSLTQQLFAPKDRPRAYGHVGSVIAVSTAVGPALGGLLISIGGADFGWRLLFWINVPITVVALIFAIRVIPGSQRHERQKLELDPIGLVLFGVAVLSLMLPFVDIPTVSQGPWRWAWLALTAVSGVAFVRWERAYQRAGKSPVVPSGLIALPAFRTGLLVMAAFFSSIGAIFLIIALFLQQGLDVPPLASGLVSIPQATLSALTAWIGGRLVSRLGRRLVVRGLIIVLVGYVAIIVAASLSSVSLTPYLVSAALGIVGFGTGFVIAPNQTITLRDVPLAQAGVGASLTQVAQRVGTAIGLAIMSAIFFASLGSGSHHSLGDYRRALVLDMVFGAALLVVALGIGIADVVRADRRAKAAPSAG